ncbi:hypothetical protein PBAC_00370 [Pedobacter glucosidilyticus]|nr:hypothetical protein [Pedobacter glucosidilyticus]KHJ39529.1 hypothetical protein PBAC_00370 [Pedobacter glucosidilyticus]
MDINGWLTIITVLTAIYALIPNEDRKLSLFGIHWIEKYLVGGILLFMIPYLIKFYDIVYRIPSLGGFCQSIGLYNANGFEPSNIALGLFFLCFLWLIFRIIWFTPKVDANSIEYFNELLTEKSFGEFYRLFTKYTEIKTVKSNWEVYREIIFHPKFINGAAVNQYSYLLSFIKSERDFQFVFRSFLENPHSPYYKEIKEHWNSYSLMNDKQFLNRILNVNISHSIGNGLFLIFSDIVSNHLRNEEGKSGAYNQQHYYPRIREEEGFDLPVYYHIRFIGLLYSSAIENKIDISTLSNSYTNMQSIYSSMVEQMVKNIVVNNDTFKKEYQTNYHWLISEIFSLNENWLTSFSEVENFSSDSSYIEFIPFSLSLCMSELYKGFEKHKISQEFINRMIYYHSISEYFGYSLNDEMKSSIERNIIERIPEKHLEPIMDYALDEKFAISFNQFQNGNFGHTNSGEQEILRRLLNFLNSRKK